MLLPSTFLTDDFQPHDMNPLQNQDPPDSSGMPDLLKWKFAAGLPGINSHLKMLPPGRIPTLPGNQEHYNESAVMVLLFPSGDDLVTCLIRRPATMKNHAGQYAFPGGKREPGDTDLVATAFREATEEIGLDTGKVEIIGELTPVFVQVSHFLITPVLTWTDRLPILAPDFSEVDEVIYVNLSDVMHDSIQTERELETITGRLKVPGYETGGCFIWGATAMILSELADLLRQQVQL